MEMLMIVRDKPTEHVLRYRGKKYQQWIHKHGEYPANMWLTYRTVHYRPASFKYLPSKVRREADKDHSTLIT